MLGNCSAFALTSAGPVIECECGKSTLRIEFDDTQSHVYVPCGICGETHMPVCSQDQLLKGASALGCSDTKQFCCFIVLESTGEKDLRELAILAEKEKRRKGSEDQEASLDDLPLDFR